MQTVLSGLSVINPMALWALLALLVPLLIHLFSRSRGRLVQIGHIDLIRQASRLQVTEFKLTQWLLLLLRLVIFTLIALILAGLATEGLDSSDSPTTYLTPAWIKASTPQEINQVLDEAEQQSSGRVFLLEPGFPRADRQQAGYGGQGSGQDNGVNSNPWSLLSERLSLERHTAEVTVYATDHMLQFGSVRPALPRAVTWRLRHPPRVTEPGYRSIRAIISFSPERASDASLLGDVLSSLQKHRLPELRWESVELSRVDEIPSDIDWFIRLGDAVTDPSDIAMSTGPRVMLTDAADGASEEASQSASFPFYPFTTFRLDRLGRQADDLQGTALLKTEDGSPLVWETRIGQLRWIQFNSRFNRQWNSLLQQAAFPELFLQLMLEPQQETRRYSDARISAANLETFQPEYAVEIPMPRRSLQGILAMLLVLAWVTERWLSERNTREKR